MVGGPWKETCCRGGQLCRAADSCDTTHTESLSRGTAPEHKRLEHSGRYALLTKGENCHQKSRPVPKWICWTSSRTTLPAMQAVLLPTLCTIQEISFQGFCLVTLLQGKWTNYYAMFPSKSNSMFRDFEVTAHIASGGPGLLWKVVYETFFGSFWLTSFDRFTVQWRSRQNKLLRYLSWKELSWTDSRRERESWYGRWWRKELGSWPGWGTPGSWPFNILWRRAGTALPLLPNLSLPV